MPGTVTNRKHLICSLETTQYFFIAAFRGQIIILVSQVESVGYFFKDCSLVIDIRLLLKLFNLMYRRSRYSKTKNYAFS